MIRPVAEAFLNSDSRVSPPDNTLAGRMQALILGRLGLVFLLLLASWWWRTSYLDLSMDSFPDGLFLFFLVTVALSAAYQISSYINKNFAGQIRIQLFIDVLLITWLVWETGDLMSPYVTLYLILVSVSALFLGKSGTLLMAALAALSFTLLATLTGQSLLYSISGEIRPSRVVQIIAFNNVAILLVGLLAARLAERRNVAEQLRHSEESFADLHQLHERIVESIDSGLITTDLDGRIYAFNRAAENITGRRAAAMIGRCVFDVFGEELRRSVYQPVSYASGGEFARAHVETSLASDNGSPPVMVACSVSPLLSKTRAMTGLIVTFNDVTHIRTLEETVRRSDRLAAVGRMAAGLAHEIRNPLGSMSSALQFIQERSPEPDDSLMNVVLSESNRLNGIITNFLAYARPADDGLAKESFAPVDVGSAIRDCVTLLRHSPEVGERHEFEYEIPGAPVSIRADETQLKQVFWNLLQNSVQAMPDGGKVSITLEDKSADLARIVISDTGGGMSPESLKHLFEPFSRGSHGTGLGLSIVHNIISGHGGRISVDSRPGRGTSFTIELPG